MVGSKAEVELAKGPGLPNCLAKQLAVPSMGQPWPKPNGGGVALVLGSVQATQGRREAGVSSSPRLRLVSATKWRRAVSAILWHPWKTKAMEAGGWDQWMPGREEKEQPNRTRLCPGLRPEMVWSEKMGQAVPFQNSPPTQAPNRLQASSDSHTSPQGAPGGPQ